MTSQHCVVQVLISASTHQLELNRHQAKVDNLHSRPQAVVGLERRKIHVPELAGDCATASTLGNGHGGEEDSQTEGRKDELVKRDTLHGGAESARLGDGEDVLEEAEPLELDGGHAEAVGHEAGEALKVKGRRQVLRVGDQVAVVEGVLAVELVDLDGDTVVLLEAAGLAEGSLADGRDGLGDRVGDATEDGVGDHHGHDCKESDILFRAGAIGSRGGRVYVRGRSS